MRWKEVEPGVAVELCMGVETEPIRVETKLDIVETEAELGTESRIHNMAVCYSIIGQYPILEICAFGITMNEKPGH